MKKIKTLGIVYNYKKNRFQLLFIILWQKLLCREILKSPSYLGLTITTNNQQSEISRHTTLFINKDDGLGEWQRNSWQASQHNKQHMRYLP